jgi:hypothetical protein
MLQPLVTQFYDSDIIIDTRSKINCLALAGVVVTKSV